MRCGEMADDVRNASSRFVAWLSLLTAIGPLLLVSAARGDEAGYISRDSDDMKSELRPAQEELAKKFANVVAWEGSFARETRGAKSGGEGPDHWSSEFDSAASGTFRLTQHIVWDKRGVFEWIGEATLSGEIGFHRVQFNYQGIGRDERARTAIPLQKKGGASFTVWIKDSFASLGASDGVEKVQMHVTGRGVGYFAPGGSTPGKYPYTINEIVETNLVTYPLPELRTPQWWEIVGGGPAAFVFTGSREEGGGAESTTHTVIEMHPVYEDVEVELTDAGYDRWRPLGRLDEPGKAGSGFALRATLKPLKPSGSSLPSVKRFRFELIKTSREPGVCLNWPLEAKDDDYDLKFAAQSVFASNQPFVAGAEIKENGQKAEVTKVMRDEKNRPFADVTVESFDFGARAELRVVCDLEDGRQIVGKLKGAPNESLVPLPRRKAGDWIAESWRKENDAMDLPASDDDEKVENQEEKGDGYTLYEEYRGWCMDGERVEGDPKKKDFFVLNFIGDDAQPGIDLFAALSQLEVHDKLRPTEMSRAARLMNGNHRAAPHRVDQHGVWIDQFTDDPAGQINAQTGAQKLGVTGAATPMTRSGVAGRPGITLGIGLLAKNDAASDFNKPYNLAPSDAAFAYDRAVAHELMHSVGVDHHGKGDYEEILTFVSPNHPLNKTGRPYYHRLDASGMDPTPLRNEAGEDLSAERMAEYPATRQFIEFISRDELMQKNREMLAAREGYQMLFKTAEEWTDYQIEELVGYYLKRRGIVGVWQGEDSGDQDCIMRYYFANFYQSQADKGALYWIAPGTEPVGFDICHYSIGTGINAPDRQPQPRYGNTHGLLGNCFAYISPNDASPPRRMAPQY